MIRRFTEWLRAEIRRTVRSELKSTLVIYSEDPLRVFQEQRIEIQEQVRQAVNVLGNDVMIGREVALWGGKFPEGLGIELHDHVRIYEHCRLVVDHASPASGIVIEERAAMNFGCYIEGSGGVRIGRHSILGPHVVVLSSGHRIDPDTPVQTSGKEFARVNIGDDVWIGANAVVLQGITIGDRAVVGAGSVVTRDIPSDTVVVGNPARILRAKL